MTNLETREIQNPRSLHFDARGSRDDVVQNLQTLIRGLDSAVNSDKEIPRNESTLAIRPPAKHVQELKLQELTSDSRPKFTIAEFVDGYDHGDSILILQNILPFLSSIGIGGEVSKHGGTITIPEIDEVCFDENGLITQSNNPAMIGKDIFHYVSCFIGQEIAVVLKKGDEFRYVSDISAFEKTPKNAEGKNQFLGRDIVDFHAKAPNFGRILAPMYRKLLECFAAGKLDLLTVDLHGGNKFFDTKTRKEIHRFERDYFLPLTGEDGEFAGFIGLADTVFKPVVEPKSPFEGGDYVEEVKTQTDLFNARYLTACDMDKMRRDLVQKLSSDEISDEERLEIAKTILEDKEFFGDEVLAQAKALNKEKFGEKIELYGISYISDSCANDCTYCGLNSGIKQERSSLSDAEMEADFEAVLQHKPEEFCILAGENPKNKIDIVRALAIIDKVNKKFGNPLRCITINMAPMSEADFREIAQSNPSAVPLQYRIFQETYDKDQYAKYHTRGPKSNFEFRRNAQQRALAGGIDKVGIGSLLGINDRNEPYKHAGNDAEILALMEHATQLGGYCSLSLPRHQPVEGYDFKTPNPVDDKLYIFYHALLRLALPNTKLMTTARETPELILELEPFINIRDLAPRPGVGGNFRERANFQNELGDSRSAGEIIRDLMERVRR